MHSLVYPMIYLSSYNTSQTLHKCQYVMCLLWNVVFAQRGACELSKAGRIKISISFGVTLCLQNHAYIYIYILYMTFFSCCSIVKKDSFYSFVLSVHGFWLPFWYLLFTASDYPFGTFCSRLLITPLISSNLSSRHINWTYAMISHP